MSGISSVTPAFPPQFNFLLKSKEECSEEFEQIPGHYGTSKVGINEINLSRNRYHDIIANDETRVKLIGRKDDYINANYCLDKSVIVGQAPMENGEMGYQFHQEDFYDVLWDEKIEAIVMLTPYSEDGRKKSSLYLGPVDEKGMLICEGTPKKIGEKYEIVVEKINSPQMQNLFKLGFYVYKVAIYKLKKKESKEIWQYHYPYWQDHAGAQAVAAYAAAQIILKKRAFVHCSAGVGRSGTVVALASILKKIETMNKGKENIDPLIIPHSVEELRKERSLCVQNADQYFVIYEAAISYLSSKFKE